MCNDGSDDQQQAKMCTVCVSLLTVWPTVCTACTVHCRCRICSIHSMYITDLDSNIMCSKKAWYEVSNSFFFCDLASMWTSSYLSVGCPKEHNMIITLVTAGAYVGEMWVMLARCEPVPTLVSKANVQAIRVKWTLLVCCWMDIANQRQAWCKYAVNMLDIRHYSCVVVRTLCPKAYPGVSCQCIPMVE